MRKNFFLFLFLTAILNIAINSTSCTSEYCDDHERDPISRLVYVEARFQYTDSVPYSDTVLFRIKKIDCQGEVLEQYTLNEASDSLGIWQPSEDVYNYTLSSDIDKVLLHFRIEHAITAESYNFLDHIYYDDFLEVDTAIYAVYNITIPWTSP